jgi:uncharacterized protein YdiU (UPF0061 family)
MRELQNAPSFPLQKAYHPKSLEILSNLRTLDLWFLHIADFNHFKSDGFTMDSINNVLKIKNRFLSEFSQLEADKLKPKASRIFEFVNPDQHLNPITLLWSENLSKELFLTTTQNQDTEKNTWTFRSRMFSGSSEFWKHTYAMRYGGHQFGHWAGQLGDGRAMYLGDFNSPTNDHWELQLKGSGQTPFSRQGDGKAVLRSSIREHLASEYMFHLDVPTTRSLACVATGENVLRDILYDGNPAFEPGAIVTRAAKSFFRFGHFQILAMDRDKEMANKLLKYVMNLSGETDPIQWFHNLCLKTAEMIVHWMRVGFVHGVMNTDNMSVHGLTIDYGPYGFLDAFDPEWTPNTTDLPGRRYAYGQQPKVAHWNLIRLAESLAFIVNDHDSLEKSLNDYVTHFHIQFAGMCGAKLGIENGAQTESDSETPIAVKLYSDIADVLTKHQVDHTLFFRTLTSAIDDFECDNRPTMNINKFDSVNLIQTFVTEKLLAADIYYQNHDASLLRQTWNKTLQPYFERLFDLTDGFKTISKSIDLMKKSNPYFVLRNAFLFDAIQETTFILQNHKTKDEILTPDDFPKLSALEKAIQNPYKENQFTKPFFVKRPPWADDRPGCSQLSCSS